jgi:hypothetical protein
MYDVLKSEIEEAAFMLVDDASRKEIHSKLVKCLIILEHINSMNSQSTIVHESDKKEEVKKVSRRLRMWSKPERQHQYNSKILNAFLELRQCGQKKITEEDINFKLGPNTWFGPNFVQMKTIADRNHGKIFDVNGNYVEIWPPVASAVDEYEKRVFQGI